MVWLIGSDIIIFKENSYGVVDRFENNNQAIILLEQEDKQIVLLDDQLPEGTEVNTWLKFEWKNEEITEIQIDLAKTKLEKVKADRLLSKLRK